MSDTSIRVDANTRFYRFNVSFDPNTYGFRGIAWQLGGLGMDTTTWTHINFDGLTGEPDIIYDTDYRDPARRITITDADTIYEWLAALTVIYNGQGFLGNDGNPITLTPTDVPFAQTLEQVGLYGGWNPFDLSTRDDWRRRQSLIQDGAEASGLSLNYTDLPVVNGIKLIPGAKWITNIFYDESIDGEAWFDTVGNIVHREEAVRNYFIHNGSATGAFTVKDNLGEVIEKIPPEHSSDVRVVREKAGRNNVFVVIREADHHLDVIDTGTAKRRRHELFVWAKQGYERSSECRL